MYGLAAVLSVFLVLMNGAVGALDKSYLVIGLLLVAAGLAAILHLGDAVGGSTEAREVVKQVEIDR